MGMKATGEFNESWTQRGCWIVGRLLNSCAEICKITSRREGNVEKRREHVFNIYSVAKNSIDHFRFWKHGGKGDPSNRTVSFFANPL